MLSPGDAVAATNDRIAESLARLQETSLPLGQDALNFLGRLSAFLDGGKRFRALCTVTGFATRSTSMDSCLIDVAASLEVFHAAALVHDDIMDRSDTRRNTPSVHRIFEAEHQSLNYAGDAAHFGEASALLFGDMLLALSDELLGRGLVRMPQHAEAVRHEFNLMRREVTLGQYLDILEEVAWPTRSEHDAVARALHVVTYKSAKYSIEAPLRIGAALAGAPLEERERLSAFGIPLGIAFQLRDDHLGVFGITETTGKPVGDDLREGKRTVLIALGQQRGCDLHDVGDPHMTGDRVSDIQHSLRESGAEAELEAMIRRYANEARECLDDLDVAEDAKPLMVDLIDRVTRRSA